MKFEIKLRIVKIANVIWGQLIVVLSALAAIRIYTEILGPKQFGTAMLTMGGLALLDSIGTMALNQTILSQCARYSEHERQRQMALGLSLAFLKWAAPIAFLIGLSFAIPLSRFNHDSSWYLLPFLLLVLIATETGKTSLLSLIVLSKNYGHYSAWAAGEAILALLGTTGALILWRADAIGFLSGYVASRLLCTTFFIFLFSPTHLLRFEHNINSNDLQSALKYGSPVAAMGPLGWVSSYLDRYILGGLLGSATTGIYAAVTGLVSRPYALTTSVLSNYFRPQFFSHSALKEGASAYSRVLRNWLLSSMSIGLTGTLAFFLLGEWISSIMLASEFREKAPLLMSLFALSQTFAITTHSADNAILALRGSRQLLHAQVLLSIFTLSLIPTGIFLGGMVGGLAGRCAAEAIKLGTVLWLASFMIKKHHSITES